MPKIFARYHYQFSPNGRQCLCTLFLRHTMYAKHSQTCNKICCMVPIQNHMLVDLQDRVVDTG